MLRDWRWFVCARSLMPFVRALAESVWDCRRGVVRFLYVEIGFTGLGASTVLLAPS